MRSALFVVLAPVLLACGDRTALEGLAVGDAGPALDAPACQGAPWLLFQLSDGTTSSLYAMRADGTHGHALALPDGVAFAAISRDGRELLYVTFTAEPDDGGYTNTLVLHDLATGARRQLATSMVQGAIQQETNALSYSAFSPDGRIVAYTDGFDVRLVNTDGTSDRLLIAGSVNDNIVFGHPLFTRDAATVLYGSSGMGASVFGSVHVDGSGSETLVAQDGVGGPAYPNPALSPDGTTVASVIQCAGMDAGPSLTTLRVYPLASLPAPCESGVVVTTLEDQFSTYNSSANPSWGPTDLIAYVSGTNVWVVHSGGGSPRNMTEALTGMTGSAIDPIWAPACAPIP